MADETYKLKVFCTNCSFHGDTDIPKGVPIDKAECPTCGNKTLERDEPVQTMDYYNFE